MKEVYEKLRGINVAGHVEQKNGLNYLSWAWAWDEVMKAYPTAKYEIIMFDNKPYLYDDKTGYMVFTKMNIEGVERLMWLPVMDSNNKAMLDHKYKYKTKDYATGGYKEREVDVATMFDINKTIMRCLVKNLAMYGLGLALYSGEDLPEEELTEDQLKDKAKKYKFAKGKKTGLTILEVYDDDPKYLQWCLDNGKDETIKNYIELITDLRRTFVPDTEEEQKEMLEKLNKFKMLDDYFKEEYYKKFNVKSSNELTLEQLRTIFN